MNKMLKLIGLFLAAMLLSACVHHHGYNRSYGNGGYYPGYGNYGNNYPTHRHPYNQPRPPAYGYGRNRHPNNPNYRNQSNSYYYQNNYYNRPQPPRPMPGYGYGPRPSHNEHRNWQDRDHDGDHDHHDHHSGRGNWQGRNGGYGRPLVNSSSPQGRYNPGALLPYRGNRPSNGYFGRHEH